MKTLVTLLSLFAWSLDVGGDGKDHQCSIFFYSDPFLWRKAMQMEGAEESGAAKCVHDFHISFAANNSTAAYERLKKLMDYLLERANEIFLPAEFYGQGRRIHRGIGFGLAGYRIDKARCHFRQR